MDRGSAAKVLSGDAAVRGARAGLKAWRNGSGAWRRSALRCVAGGQVVAAVSVSGPIERTTRQPGRRYAPAVRDAARDIEAALGEADGRFPDRPLPAR